MESSETARQCTYKVQLVKDRPNIISLGWSFTSPPPSPAKSWGCMHERGRLHYHFPCQGGIPQCNYRAGGRGSNELGESWYLLVYPTTEENDDLSE